MRDARSNNWRWHHSEKRMCVCIRVCARWLRYIILAKRDMRKYTHSETFTYTVKWNDKVFMKMFFHYVRTICYEVVFCVCVKGDGNGTYEATVSRWCKVYIPIWGWLWKILLVMEGWWWRGNAALKLISKVWISFSFPIHQAAIHNTSSLLLSSRAFVYICVRCAKGISRRTEENSFFSLSLYRKYLITQ